MTNASIAYSNFVDLAATVFAQADAGWQDIAARQKR